MTRKFYTHAKEAMDEMDKMLTSLETSDSLAEISRLEVGIRKKAEEIMVYAGMIPNKDANLTAYARRKEIRGNAISAADRVREIIAKTEEKPVVSKTQMRKKAIAKKSSKKKGTK